MKHLSASEFREIAVDIEVELGKLARLRQEIEELNQLIDTFPQLADHLRENQAFRLHNFYNGCERIFRIVASELNGALPSAYDWHKRLLERMAVPHEGRPALISTETARLLEKFLGFRHVMRNIYGFELEIDRVAQLVEEQSEVWQRFETDVQTFLTWLREMAEQLE